MSETSAPVVQSRGTVYAQGSALLAAIHGAAQALRLYPLENDAVQNALSELQRTTQRALAAEGSLELKLVGDFIFLNDARLRLDLANYGAFSFLSRALGKHRIGTLAVAPPVQASEWASFLSLVLRDAAADDPYVQFVSALEETPVRHIRVEEDRAGDSPIPEDEEARTAAKRVYMQSVQVARDVLTDTRLARAVNVRRVKRAVQGIVDQVLSNEEMIVSMTALRDCDEYTFTHSVNVCIFSVVLGQKLGLSRTQLYELGIGALLHDVGKMRISPELLRKGADLTEEDWAELREHPAEGLLALFAMHGFGALPYRTILVVYEHHMREGGRGYPRNRRPRTVSLFSRIVGVSDAFDAGTSQRSYQNVPWPPDEVLREMRDNPERGHDTALVKALINVTGVYPVGTLVILDTFELALVTARNPDLTKIHQPIVKILVDPMGIPLNEPEIADLAEVDPATGEPFRTILKTTDPEKYGINISEHFL